MTDLETQVKRALELNERVRFYTFERVFVKALCESWLKMKKRSEDAGFKESRAMIATVQLQEAIFERDTLRAQVEKMRAVMGKAREACSQAKGAFENNWAIDWNIFDEALREIDEAMKP